ncbi:MAG TPA: virulence factor TspB C-terminal domain-related protein, partial [Xylella fastidiosa subsp. multiplex]
MFSSPWEYCYGCLVGLMCSRSFFLYFISALGLTLVILFPFCLFAQNVPPSVEVVPTSVGYSSVITDGVNVSATFEARSTALVNGVRYYTV